MEKQARRNIRLVVFESVVTAGMLSIPIMTPFFHSIGLSQEQIAWSQMACVLALMFLNLPAGWMADRFSRKWANVIGDLGIAISLLLYSQVQGFAGVVICEILFGVSMAFSSGVDASLLRHFAGKIDASGRLFEDRTAHVVSLQQVFCVLLVLLGGPIGAIDFRLAIALSSVVYFAGGIAALFIQDDSERLTPQYRNPFADMARVTRNALHDPILRLRLAAFAVAYEVTHGMIWVFTPLMLLAGVPLAIVSVGWAINAAAGFMSAKLAQCYADRLEDWQNFAITIMLVVIAMGILSWQVNVITIWLYGLMGAAQSWAKATMLPLVQRDVDSSEQTTIVSLAKVAGWLLYIPSVWLIGVAADVRLEYSMLMTLAIFVPLGVLVGLRLKRES